jgi:hypothetical protein
MHILISDKTFAGVGGMGKSVSVKRRGKDLLVIKADPAGVAPTWDGQRREWRISVALGSIGLHPRTPDGRHLPETVTRIPTDGVMVIVVALPPAWIGVQSTRFRKVSDLDAFEIRNRVAAGEHRKDLAIEYGVAFCTIGRIMKAQRDCLQGEAPLPDLRSRKRDARHCAAISAGLVRKGIGGPSEKTLALLETVRTYRADRMTYRDIALCLGCSQPYIHQAIKRWGHLTPTTVTNADQQVAE